MLNKNYCYYLLVFCLLHLLVSLTCFNMKCKYQTTISPKLHHIPLVLWQTIVLYKMSVWQEDNSKWLCHSHGELCSYIHVFIKTRRYGPLRGPTFSSCRGLWPLAQAFFWTKKELIMRFWPIFWQFLVSRSNLVNF